ncbi:hypothetical protein DM02DRAFT_692984 [Periconia macrospinosa]|uniref:Rhodopsin domain-containing protein n=1 Tax=Periconia macrospinosa TaxID=97972 RepID=A0A2V1DAE8_9PLEO|nr:hypothetical protein DM02DRAFT_692984 [Periconia macrospinosa]
MAGVDIPRWMWALADDYPFAPPPEGVVPNFEHPKLVHNHSISIACGISMFLLVVFSGIRFYAKLSLIRKRTLDDYFYWMSLLMLLLLEALYMYLDNHGGYGYHVWEIKLRAVTKPILVITFIGQIVLQIAIWLIKATILILIMSAFEPVKHIRILCWGGIIGTCAFYFANLIVQVVSCRPRGGTDRIAFLAGIASYQCAGTNAAIQKMSIIAGCFGVVSDIYILIIPLPAIAKLKISQRQKIGVYLIFTSGFMACVASVLSLAFRITAWKTKDLTVDSIPSMTAQIVELTVGLIITCMASVAKLSRFLFAARFPKLFGETTVRDSGAKNEMQPWPRRRHAPSGLSELDSMKTFGTTVDVGTSRDSSSTRI